MWQTLHDLVATQLENQFFSGGALIVLITGVLASMRKLPVMLGKLLVRRLVTTVDVSESDQSFFWLQAWLSDHPYTRKAKLLTLSTKTAPYAPSRRFASQSDYNSKSRLPRIIFSPAPGKHLFFYKRYPILLERDRQKSESIQEVPHSDTFILRSFSKKAIHELVMEARDLYYPGVLNTQIWKPYHYDWSMVQKQPPRSFDSVILPSDKLDDLRQDVDWFLNAKDWYLGLGIPYRRGYLLHGPPGNGKTSTVSALAGSLGRDLYILSLSGVDDTTLMNLVVSLPEHALLLIEDIDCIAKGREITNGSNEKLTFSGFLNAIDGVGASEGRILIMTTNHPEKLDPALIRPGRADRSYEFPHANEKTAQRMFLRFFPGQHDLAAKFGESVGKSTTPYSMAMIQEHLIRHRDSSHTAAKME